MLSSRVKGLAQLQGMVQTVVRVKPDFYWFWGTERKLSTALIGAYMNIPVAHIAGGQGHRECR